MGEMKHTISCPAYSNYQPPYEDCTCGVEKMTNLKDINFGINQYCGPAVLSALTGESTDRCAAVISAVSDRKEIKAVQRQHLIDALLVFDLMFQRQILKVQHSLELFIECIHMMDCM